jgi:hypothetical protein
VIITEVECVKFFALLDIFNNFKFDLFNEADEFEILERLFFFKVLLDLFTITIGFFE